MRPGQRKIRADVVEAAAFPTVHGMAFQAIMRKLPSHVVRIANIIIIVLMARPAIGRSALELPVYVALRAVHAIVRPEQRKGRIVVVERGWLPRGSAVTNGAVVRILIRLVIGRAAVICLVTRPAVGGSSLELSIHVALCTTGIQVSPG